MYFTLGNLLLIIILLLFTIFLLYRGNKRVIFPYFISFFLSIYIYEELLLKSDFDFLVNLGDYSSGKYFRKDVPNLGYGPPKDGSFSSIKLKNNDTVYSVIYSIKDKIRITPSSNNKVNNQILFLGCSQTFGEGLNDNETLPHYFGLETNNFYQIKNYGFHGYGPHNIHSLVKYNILENSSDEINAIVLYSFYWYHINRAISNVSKNEPWYEVENNQLIYKGVFQDKQGVNHLGVISKYYDFFINRVVRRSNIYKKHFLNEHMGLELNSIKKYDIKRSLFLINDISNILKSIEMNFVVIVDKEISKNNFIMNYFKINNITNICLDCEISDLENNDLYKIQNDGHNSAHLNRLKAKILSDKLLSLNLINF